MEEDLVPPFVREIVEALRALGEHRIGSQADFVFDDEGFTEEELDDIPF